MGPRQTLHTPPMWLSKASFRTRSFAIAPRPCTSQALCAPQSRYYQSSSQPRAQRVTAEVSTSHKGQQILHPDRDEGIRSRMVKLVDKDTNRLVEKPLVTILDELKGLEDNKGRKKYFVVRVSTDEETGLPICKILLKKDVYAAERDRQIAAHNADHTRKGNKKVKKSQGEMAMVKILEIGWAIEPGDLEIRIKRMKESLKKGFRVEVALHTKKKGKEVSKDRAESVLRRVQRGVEESNGRTMKEDGVVSGVYRMLIEPTDAAKTKDKQH